jgi:hypothetical protein
MQEDLATLMKQHLILDNNNNNANNYHTQLHPPPIPPRQVDLQTQTTFITQHYHHSAHQASKSPLADGFSIKDELARHGIDMSNLLLPQISLFRESSPEQQLRLVQLWTIAPLPSRDQIFAGEIAHWKKSSMQQEETAARFRYDSIHGESQRRSSNQRNGAEPYMDCGYDTTSVPGILVESAGASRTRDYNRALDPAYQSSEWWMRESQPIGNPHGLVQQAQQPGDQDEDML